jgi:hypothetical protein
MTKAHEHGENEVSIAAKLEAARTGRPICDILAEWLRNAKQDDDQDRIRKIVKAQKYLGCRNIRKRRGPS